VVRKYGERDPSPGSIGRYSEAQGRIRKYRKA
jgi:hypothetical protein